jgi:hypothetical protein
MRDDDRRLARLRELVDRLERLPESAHRDWMLDEVRARMVDVDTGVQPEPLRPRHDIEAEREAARTPRGRPRLARDARVEAREAAPPQQASDLAGVPGEDGAADRRDEGESGPDTIGNGDVLSLEDSPDDPDTPPASGLPGWRRGLRG